MDSPIVQDEASVPPSKRLKQDRSNPPQPKERSSSTVSDTATGSPLVHHDGLDLPCRLPALSLLMVEHLLHPVQWENPSLSHLVKRDCFFLLEVLPPV